MNERNLEEEKIGNLKDSQFNFIQNNPSLMTDSFHQTGGNNPLRPHSQVLMGHKGSGNYFLQSNLTWPILNYILDIH